jgi:FMN-dependent oxidoreductase (nitrilotriacetate monooxygenase family)
MTAKMHLAFDLSFTHMQGRWRLPGSWTGRTFPDFGMFEEAAKIAERGCIDMLFFGDGTGIPSTWRGSLDAAVKWGIAWPRLDMSPWIAALSRVTSHVGFGLTYATTFMHPFYVARLLNSLDHVTGGRIAFNVITSTRRADAANYGFDELMEHGARYDRMEEFVDVCKALWDSVAPDAFQWDRESGVVADPAKVHAIDHVGRFFKVKGPLNTVPSPQGHPVLVQAGSSPRGIAASAHFADHVFAAGKPLAQKVQHRRDLDTALVARGRDPSQVGMLFEVVLIVAETQREALAQRERMLTTIPSEAVGAFLSHWAGYDFSRLPDRFVPEDINREIAASNASPVGLMHQFALEVGGDSEVTREEFFRFGLTFATAYDHAIAGTAAQVADLLEEEFEATGSRGGYMVAHPTAMPRDFLNIVDYLVPELRRRGRFRDSYEGRTLKENLATA